MAIVGVDRLFHSLLRQSDVFIGCLARLVPERQLNVFQCGANSLQLKDDSHKVVVSVT